MTRRRSDRFERTVVCAAAFDSVCPFFGMMASDDVGAVGVLPDFTLEKAVGSNFEAEKRGVLLWKTPTAEQLEMAHPPFSWFSL